MRVHAADTTTPYIHYVRMLVKFKNPTIQAKVAEHYIDTAYVGLRDTVVQNKRPANLCGVSELHDEWTISGYRYIAYSVELTITGYGVEYNKNELITFFMSVFPQFKPEELKTAKQNKQSYNEHIIAFDTEI